MSRIREIDDIKSALVVIMLLYHAASALPKYRENFIWLTEELYFIHFAFVLVSGLLCGLHYNDRDRMGARPVRRELVVRGLKIWGIFLTSNILLYAAGILRWPGGAKFLQLNGGMPFNMNGSIWAFEILYYIGAFLIASSCLLRPVPGWCVLLLGLGGIWFEQNNLIFCIGWGCVGFGLGDIIRSFSTDRVFENFRHWGWYTLPGLMLYLIFCDWKNIPHRSYWLVSETLLWFGTFIWLLGISRCGHFLEEFGRYTMLAYLGQVVLMAALGRLLCRFSTWPPVVIYGVNLLITMILLLIALKMLDRIRKKVPVVDWSYRKIFG